MEQSEVHPRVHMTGSEWFGSRSGGLNRYFESLFIAMHSVHGDSVTAQAFGQPPTGGSTWGAVGMPMAKRMSTLRHSVDLPSGAILDRHFCLYGQNAGLIGRKATLVVHFQGPWAAESAYAGERRAVVSAKYIIERLRYARAEHFIVLSSRFRELLVDRYGVDDERVTILAPGVDLDRFTLAPLEDVGEVLCVRRLERRMGIDYLIRSWPAVIAQHAEAVLRIVGRGTDEARLRRLVDEVGVADSVVFEGSVDDARLSYLYARASFTVVPSVELEGFGLIALESLASGKAPIVTDCGGLPDAVRGLDETLIVSPKSVDALSERILAAFDGKLPTPDACRAHAEKFSWDAVARKHFDLYETIT